MAKKRDASPAEPEWVAAEEDERTAKEPLEIEPSIPERTHSTTTLPLVGRRQVLLSEQLDRRRGEDGATSSLHRRLEERLAQEPTPILWRMSGDDRSERVPEQIGPYRILSLLGEGGMGTVYLAEQTEPIRRRVAIKLIHSNLLGRQAVLRFEAERQALARMQHPNIAQVFDAGTTEDGHPFVVMEALEGDPVTGYCDRRKLDLRQRLDIFRDICEGVHHAHQKGVLHRDLKPSNVLVVEDEDGRPRVKIIDFGVAKALDDPLVDATQLTGDRVVGTPAYLSPESIDMPEQGADVRSDVYALGVILYQLICGCRPFERVGEGHVEFLWRIVKEEPRRPSQRFADCAVEQQTRLARERRLSERALRRRLERELDWVAIKAIAKDRDARYPSVAELGADVGRYLRGEPVQAGSPGRLYRLGKLVRRHRLPVAAAVLLLLTLVGGIVARTLEAQRANREAEAAQRAQQEAQRAVEEARQVAQFLTEMFRVADPYRRSEDRALTVREVLDRAVEQIDDDLHDQPRVRANLLTHLANVYVNLGESVVAEKLAREALELLEAELGGVGSDDDQLLQALAFALWRQGKLEEAEEAFERTLALCQRSGEHNKIAAALMNLGAFFADQGRFEEAEESYRTGLDLEADVPEPPQRTATHLANFGGVLARGGKFAEAERVLRRGAEIIEENRLSDHALAANVYNNLGNVLASLGELDEAIVHYQRAIEIREANFGPDDESLASPLNNLAGLLTRDGRLREGEQMYRRGIAIREAQLGSDHPRVPWMYRNLASNLKDQGRADEAEAMGRDVLERLQGHFGPDHTEVAQSWHFLCIVESARARPAAAVDLCRKAIDIQEAIPGGESAQLARMWRDLAWAFEDLGRLDARREALLQTEAIFARHLPADHHELIEIREELASEEP